MTTRIGFRSSLPLRAKVSAAVVFAVIVAFFFFLSTITVAHPIGFGWA